MLKDYKAVAIKESDGTGENSYTFISQGVNEKEAYFNAKHHIAKNLDSNAIYHIELKLIGDSLIQ